MPFLPTPPNALARGIPANRKQRVFYLFTPHQAGQAPQHPSSVLLISGRALQWSSWLSLLLLAQDECSRWTTVARDTCKSNNCQLLQSSKDTCNNKIKGVGPRSLSMVSSKRTGGAIDGFIEGRQWGNREHVGPLPYQWFHRMGQGALSMVSSKDAKEVGNREHHMHSWICVAFHLWFAA